MRKTSIFIAIFVITSSIASADVIFEMNTEIFGTWTKENSPYIINGRVTIPKNRTLIIEEGVTVKLKTGTYYDLNDTNFDIGFLNIEGNIIVNGTKNNPVTFTRSSNRGNWGIIYISSNNPYNIFNYTIIEYASKIDNVNKESSDNRGAITLFNATCNLNNVLFRNNTCFGLLLSINSNSNVSYCSFINNDVGIIIWFNSFINIENSIFWENDSTFWGFSDSQFNIKNNLIQISDNEGDYTRRVINDLGGNLYNLDPLFTNDSFMILRNNSPCRRIGLNRSTIGAFQN